MAATAATDGFLYVGVRHHYPVRAERSGSPEALTAGKSDVLRGYLGRELDLTVLATPFPHFRYSADAATPYASTRLRLAGAEWKPRDGVPVAEADGTLLLEFRATDRMFLRDLVDRRDIDHRHTDAFQRKLVHWGTQNWGGLTFRLLAGSEILYCCDVDVFAPEEATALDGRLFMFGISVDPTRAAAAKTVRRLRSEPSVEAAPGRHPQPRDGMVTELVGVCVRCGQELSVPRTLYDVSARHGGYVMVPCPPCGRGQMLRVLGDAEARRQGYRFQVVDDPASG